MDDFLEEIDVNDIVKGTDEDDESMQKSAQNVEKSLLWSIVCWDITDGLIATYTFYILSC